MVDGYEDRILDENVPVFADALGSKKAFRKKPPQNLCNQIFQ